MKPYSYEEKEKLNDIKSSLEIESQHSSNINIKKPPQFISDVELNFLLKKLIKKLYNILDSYLYFWVIPVLKKAYNSTKSITPSSLPDLPKEYKAVNFYKELKPIWKESMKRSSNKLIASIIKSNKDNTFKMIILNLFDLVFSTCNVWLFKQILLCYSEKSKPKFSFKYTVILLLMCKLINIFIKRKSFYIEQFQSAKIKNQLKALIYNKLLKITKFTKYSEGEIINFIQNDSEKFIYFLNNIQSVIMAPIQITIYLIMLFQCFGYIFTIGVLLLLIFLYFSYILQKQLLVTQMERQKRKDEKMKEITNVISTIKSIKLYGWEDFFLKKIKEKNNSEIKTLDKYNQIQLIIYSIYDSITIVIYAISIILYFLVYGKMDLSNVFTSMYIFQSLNEPLINLPSQLSSLFNAMLSLKRIEQFLLIQQKNGKQLQRLSPVSEEAIIIDKCSFGYIDEKIKILNNINLTIKKGKLIGILGTVGSGKTSLFNAILNNFDILDNKNIENEQDLKKIKVNGKISYVSQNPWILNETLMNNILFFNEMNEEKYQKIIEVCQLLPDIKTLKGGDMAEIGAKGLNLSGGQKARIAIARAIYSDSDIYLLDDPLASVDAFVGQQLFFKVFKKYLNGKTRLLITHSIQFIDEFDEIIYMKKGEIEFYGDINLFKKSKYFDELSLIANKKLDKKIDNNKKEDEDKENINSENENNEGKKKSKNKEDKKLKKVEKLTTEEKSNNRETNIKEKLDYFVKFTGPKYMIRMFIANIFWKVFQVSSDYFLSYWSEQEDTPEKPVNNFLYLFLYTLLSILVTIFILFNTSSANSYYSSYYRSINEKLLSKFIKAPINLFYDIVPQGRIISVISSDANRAPKLVFALDSGIRTTFQLLSCLFICYLYSWQCLFILPFLIYIEFKITRFYNVGGTDLVTLENKLKGPIVSVFNETIPGVSIIRAFKYKNQFKNKLYNKLDDHFKVSIYDTGCNNWFILNLNLVSFCILFSIIIFSALFKNKLTQATMGLLLTYSMKLTNNLFKLFTTLSRMDKVTTSTERCIQYLDIPQEQSVVVPKSENQIEISCDNSSNNNFLKISNKFIKEGTIEFKDYTAKYRPETPITLNNVNISIKKNEKIGVVGRTGSGKSTLVLAIFRIIESYKGKILIDGIDISQVDLEILRNNITIIPQEPYLFEGTLRENLDPSYDYTDAMIKSTLINCGLIRFIENLYIKVNVNGDNFSSGEKQLLCFARAMLRKNKVILMDEATSNIDYNTEVIIQELIDKYFSNSTVVTIAHRIKTIINYDRILVLDHGNVVEFDTPVNLLANPNGIFHSLYTKSTLN